ncbi:RNA polymerase subunit sigma-70 [Mycolicibacterium moriokaense]|nr:RNA polymerase subunit sigma-70 [Mycolicibacterium moriokaense]
MTITSVLGTGQADRNLAARFAMQTEPLLDVLSRGARRLTRCDADADDLLQDALLHAFAGFHTFREGTNLQAWLFRIMYNRWVSMYRSKRRRPAEVSVDRLTEHDLCDSAVPWVNRSAEAEALNTLPDNEIKAAMDALPAGFAEVVYYADVAGYTCAETAAILGVPLGTVMSRVSRARARLRFTLAHLADDRRDVAAEELAVA